MSSAHKANWIRLANREIKPREVGCHRAYVMTRPHRSIWGWSVSAGTSGWIVGAVEQRRIRDPCIRVCIYINSTRTWIAPWIRLAPGKTTQRTWWHKSFRKSLRKRKSRKNSPRNNNTAPDLFVPDATVGVCVLVLCRSTGRMGNYFYNFNVNMIGEGRVSAHSHWKAAF